MLHETLASSSTSASARATDALRPIAGGEAWIVPHEPGGYPWLSALTPTIRIVDQRAARRAATAR